MLSIDDIKQKLQSVKYPGFSKSIIDFDFVKDIQVEKNTVKVFLDITSSAIEVENELRENIKKVIETSEVNVEITIKKPEAPKTEQSAPAIKNIAPNIKNFVMVSSGKGGIGKSTTSVNLAVALAMQGKKVGLLDADIYGPNIPRMVGLENEKPEIYDNKVVPFEAYGVQVMSMGSLVEEGQAMIWRGAMVMKAITQLLRDIRWANLDVLVIDMPPGTGDAQLTLAQSVPVTAGINVTTPQQVALDDSARSLEMFAKLNIPIAGIIENMSGFLCGSCGAPNDIFGSGTCDALAKKYNTKVLAHIPLEPSIRESGDEGKPTVYFHPDSVSGKRYLSAASALWESIVTSNEEKNVSNASIQPTTDGVSACSTH